MTNLITSAIRIPLMLHYMTAPVYISKITNELDHIGPRLCEVAQTCTWCLTKVVFLATKRFLKQICESSSSSRKLAQKTCRVKCSLHQATFTYTSVRKIHFGAESYVLQTGNPPNIRPLQYHCFVGKGLFITQTLIMMLWCWDELYIEIKFLN